MSTVPRILTLALTCHCALGCEAAPSASGGASASSTPSATVTASATAPSATASATAAAAANKCAPLGCQGDGTFFKKCDCSDPARLPPVPFTWKKVAGESFDRPSYEVTNTSDKPTHWGSVAVYYYDAAGKQLETTIKETKYTVSRSNGSNFSFKPGETKTMGLGFETKSAPKDAKDMQVVIDGWCYGTYEDEPSHLCINLPTAPEERPRQD